MTTAPPIVAPTEALTGPLVGLLTSTEILTASAHLTGRISREIAVSSIGAVPIGLFDVSSALASALSFPPWVGDVFRLAGFSVFLIGVLAWLTSRHANRRRWGQHVTVSGIALIILGFAFTTFIDLLKYVFT